MNFINRRLKQKIVGINDTTKKIGSGNYKQ